MHALLPQPPASQIGRLQLHARIPAPQFTCFQLQDRLELLEGRRVAGEQLKLTMCGIFAVLGLPEGDWHNNEKRRREFLRLSHLLKHRGPDQRSCYQSPDGRAFIGFERLMIVDPTDTGRCGGSRRA